MQIRERKIGRKEKKNGYLVNHTYKKYHDVDLLNIIMTRNLLFKS